MNPYRRFLLLGLGVGVIMPSFLFAQEFTPEDLIRALQEMSTNTQEQITDGFNVDMGLGLGSLEMQERIAESFLEDLEQSALQFELIANPTFPNPGESVTVTLNDYSMNSAGARIEWYIDGQLQSGSNNHRSIALTAPAIGSTRTVRARFVFADGRTTEQTHTVRPINIDIIVEPDTRVPMFYRGRPLASQQSDIRAVALVYTSANSAPASNLAYRWRSGGKVIEGGSLFEGNIISFTPPLRRQIDLSVEVIDTNGTVLGSQSVTIPLVTPEFLFYETNPLRGLSRSAINDTVIMTGAEVSVRAEPYFISSDVYADPNRIIEWNIGGQRTSNTGGDPYLLTVQRQGNSGSTGVSLSLRSFLRQAQMVQGSFRIQH